MGDTLKVLRQRDTGLLLVGRFISSSGDWMYQIALMLAIYQYSHGKTYLIGLFWVARLVPNLVLGPFSGALADRLGYRKAMIAADLERMVLVLFLAVALRPSTWVLIYPVVIGVQVGSSVFNPSSVGLIPRIVATPQDRLAANAAVMQVTSLAIIAGSAIGGVATGLGYTTLLLIDAATFIVSAACLSLLRPRQAPVVVATPNAQAAEEENPHEGVLGAFRMLTSRPALVFAAVVMALPELASGAVVVWIVPYTHTVLHLPSSGVGYLYAALGLGSVLGGFVASALGSGTRLDALLAASVAAGGVALAAFGVIPIGASALICLLIVGIAETVEYAAYQTLLQQAIPEAMIGRAAGTMSSYLFNMMLVGNVVSGFLAALIGLPVSIGGLGVLTLVAAAAGWWYLRVRTAGRPDALALERVSAFRNVPFDVREWAVRRMAREDFPAGATIVRQGEKGERFYTIARGTARVIAQTEGGVVNNTLGPGDFFGEIALVQNVRRTATVTAETPLITWVLNREDFDELQARAADFRESILETATARLNELTDIQLPLATRLG